MVNSLKKINYNSSGQVLLIVAITMIVALTAGLTIASKSIVNLRLAKQNQESQRAFQAASAGIEKLLNAAAGVTQSGDLDSAKFQTRVLEQNQATVLLNNGADIDQDRGMDLWLSAYPDFTSQYNGTINLKFGLKNHTCGATSGPNVMPALEVVLLTGNKNNPALSKYVFDPCAGRRAQNFFTNSVSGTSTIEETEFFYSTGDITVTNGLIGRIIPIYNSAVIGIQWGTLPSPVQGKLLESIGTSGETTRKVVYFESLPQTPAEVFPYAILSQ